MLFLTTKSSVDLCQISLDMLLLHEQCVESRVRRARVARARPDALHETAVTFQLAHALLCGYVRTVYVFVGGGSVHDVRAVVRKRDVVNSHAIVNLEPTKR